MSISASGGGGSGGGVRTYANVGVLPTSAPDGSLALTIDTDPSTLWTFDAGTSAWKQLSTSYIVEGANLYYTQARADARADARITAQKGAASGLATLDASSLIPITQMPPAAIERLVVVADQAARYALTTATVQNGDTVKQTDTGEMWYVKDDTQLSGAGGYAVYTAGTASSAPWSGITGKPAAVTALSGTNTGDVTLAAVGAAPNANGASLSGQALTLQPADGSNPGLLSAAGYTSFSTAAALVNTAQSGRKFLASPSDGSSAAPAMRALVAADVPTLNQNTTGTAATFTGSLTGDVTSTAMATTVAFVGGVSAANVATAATLVNTAQSGRKFLASPNDGTSGAPAMRAIVAADIPTLNQNTTGTAANVTGTVAIANGGTGQTAKAAAFDALAPGTTLGDVIYHDGTNHVRLAGNTTTTAKALVQTGNGSVSAAPAWTAIALAIGDSYVHFYNPSGTASVNTQVHYFATKTSAGTDLTGTQSSTNGDSITVNTTGLYEWSAHARYASTDSFCVTKNSTAYTQDPSSANWGGHFSTPTYGGACARVIRCVAGDVLRFVQATVAAGAQGNPTASYWTVRRIG